MRLISLSVENFGVLHGEVVECTDGLNVFCRENGTGKTTLAAFLCAMLYGLPTSRKNDLDENERKKYLPWQGGPFGGSITFSVGEKTYRAERYFANGASSARDTFVLYDLADNSVSQDYSEQLGRELFGLDAAAFERSVYLPQKRLAMSGGNESITARLSRAMDGTEDGADADLYRSAAALLDKQRQYYARHGGKGYVSELEELLSSLHEQEYTAIKAREDAARYSAEAGALEAELNDAVKEKERLTRKQHEAQVRRTVLAHGKSLLDARDNCLSAAAQRRQFLHTDDAEGIAAGRFGAEAIAAAEATVRDRNRMAERFAIIGASMTQLQQHREDAKALFRDGIPDAAVLESLAFSQRMLEELSHAGEDDGMEALPACFSEEELQRHMTQALMHAQMTEVLARPQDARNAYLDAMHAAGLEEGDALPDDDTMQAYADVLGAIAANREKQQVLLPQKTDADEALQTLQTAHGAIPAQSEIVAMRTRFDALRARTEEIEELEARQRLAVQVDETIRRSRRVKITVGIGLLVIAVVLCVLFAVSHDIRLAAAGGVTALPGLLLFIVGLLTRADENDETRALDDAAFKRLCVKKSEYEAEKTQIYEFLDSIGGDAAAVLDAEEAAQRFDAAAAAAREREAAAVGASLLDAQYRSLTEEEAQLCASLSSYTKSGGGELADIGDDRAVFSEYRNKIGVCHEAQRAYDAERTTRTQARARVDALALALDGYLSDLENNCPKQLQKCGDTEGGTYSERMTAWCRTADLLRMRIGERQTVAERRKQTEEALSQKLDALLVPNAVLSDADAGSSAMSVLDRVRTILSLCERDREYAAELAVLEEHRLTAVGEAEALDAELRRFLDGYFDSRDITPEDGLRIIRSRETALAEEMNALREAQRRLAVFLTEYGLTEDALTEALGVGCAADADSSDASADSDAEDTIRRLTDRRAAVMQSADTASRIGAALPGLRAQIEKTEGQLVEARKALDVIRQTQACLEQATEGPWQAGIVLLGNAGGENTFVRVLAEKVQAPLVGGSGAIHPETGESALVTGR
ncbi:MAG: AAA family ATPase, partial [Clostridia bacterium]|nr:AAA family ATPase [Clostridia bacterium]